MQQLGGGYLERERAQKLLEADKRLHISYESLRLTVEYFAELNRSVLSRIRDGEVGSATR